jgi:SARP family transcriptional regulator, regulator of embCAB operon
VVPDHPNPLGQDPRTAASAGIADGGPSVSWEDDGEAQQRLELGGGATPVTIGRRPDSAIALPWDREVSRVHAQIERVGSDWVIDDDGLSRNGTWVNGERLRGRRRLLDGDVVRIGRTLLHFHASDRPESEPTYGVTGDSGLGAAEVPRILVYLCGQLELRIDGRSRGAELSGRIGRRLFAYLVTHHGEALRRDELTEVLWPRDERPASPEAGLSVHLARLRRVLGDQAVVGRSEVRLAFRDDLWVDVEQARRWRDEARAKLGLGAPGEALAAARAAPTSRLSQGLLPEFADEDWVREGQHEVDLLVYELLELEATAALEVGGVELSAAEQAARELVRLDDLRESGYRLLLRVHAAMGNPAQASQVYHDLRRHLMDELGMPPGAETRELYERLIS